MHRPFPFTKKEKNVCSKNSTQNENFRFRFGQRKNELFWGKSGKLKNDFLKLK